MSPKTEKDFDRYARDCVRLAGSENVPPELRNQLLAMAREWMQAAMEEQDGESIASTDRALPSLPSQ
jgi:hypothetical protein